MINVREVDILETSVAMIMSTDGSAQFACPCGSDTGQGHGVGGMDTTENRNWDAELAY